MIAAVVVVLSACSTNVQNVVKNSTERLPLGHNVASGTAPESSEKSATEQLKQSKADLEAQIVILKREIGRLENIGKTKKGGLDQLESVKLMIARKDLSEYEGFLRVVNGRLKVSEAIDRVDGSDDDGESLLPSDDDHRGDGYPLEGDH